MQVRHQTFFIASAIIKIGIGLDLIDRRQPQPRKIRHVLQNLAHELAERRAARKIAPVRRDIDARQHDLRISLSTRWRTCVTTSPAGTERDGPRPNGMMQNVQR